MLSADGEITAVDARNRVTVAEYDPATTEDGLHARAVYQVDDELAAGNDTVKDTLLDLVDRGELDATIVKQPFYLDESFDGGYDAGWRRFEGVVQLEGMEIDMTEFSYGSDPDNLELAQNGIAEATIDEGAYIDFKASEQYTCGTVDNDTAHREAWEDRYGAFDRFDSDTERGVYAAMLDGATFDGNPLDLSLYEEARDAYIDAAGVAPEQVIDNVVYEPDTFDTGNEQPLLA